jgi:hypothetical protein
VQNSRIVSAFAAIAVSAVLLTGCSAVSAIEHAQTKVQACATIDANLLAVSKKMSTLTSSAQSDPKGTAKQIDAVATKFAGATKKLNNKSVKAAAVKAAASLSAFSKDLDSIVAGPTSAAIAKFQKDSSGLQTNFAKITAVCKP